MPISNYFPNLTLSEDQYKAFKKITEFLSSSEDIFLLKGYAGSGKTTILKGLIKYIESLQKEFQVMAPTGRAARILQNKTNFGTTIHKGIYNFLKLIIKNEGKLGEENYKYIYPIRQEYSIGKIFIIDEASMISNKENKQEFWQCGTDILLEDLLTFSRIKEKEINNKIIFVGDPAQLPPVGDNQSSALSLEFFKNKNLTVNEIEMTQVMRQTDNLILKNATKIRNLIKETKKYELTFDYNKDDFIKLTNINIEIVSKYVDLFPIPELGQGVIIAYSNKQCLNYNQSIRSHIFAGKQEITVGDILLICNNSYTQELMNGDMVKVMEVAPELIERKNIPVYEKYKDGRSVKKPQNLSFRKIKVRSENSDTEKEFFIIENLLNSPNRDLSKLEIKALFVDFKMRHQNIKEESDDFKQKLKDDPLFNAVRVKYGYAITCHKSQGSEWHTTFVDYSNRISLKEMPLRWCYTATTRAVERCFTINAPHFTALSNFNISAEIGQISKIPENALSLKNIPLSPFHSEKQHKCKSQKYWEVEKELSDTPYNLLKVTSLGDYMERYTIFYNKTEMNFDIRHNKAGFFQEFMPVTPNQSKEEKEILEILNKASESQSFDYNIDYQPSLEVLAKLYQLMQLACAECEVFITNIEEKTANYLVTYFLKSSSKGAYIQFYFNNNNQLTRALPKSFDSNDEKLNQLIKKLKEYVV